MFYVKTMEKLCYDLSAIMICHIVPLRKAMSKQTFFLMKHMNVICEKEGILEYFFQKLACIIWIHASDINLPQKHCSSTLNINIVNSDMHLKIQTMHCGVSTAKCLCDRATMLHYTYIAYLITWYFISPRWKFLDFTTFEFRNRQHRT